MKLHRKLRKLIRDPKQFWNDMLIKRTRKLAHLTPKKLEGHYRYTVVSAVYNVAPYLDDFFESLLKQRLDFERNIHLVMVDDGSLDDSAKIITDWQARFPRNIVYLKKENGGQASARNLGLKHVETDWVTFIDPDDTVDFSYFKEIDELLYKNRERNVRMVGVNLLFHYEETGKISNSHPLNYRFKNGDVLLPLENLGKHVQLSAATAVFNTKIIDRYRIEFDELIRPNFEDAHFVGVYLSKVNGGTIGFSSKAKYYYRKRSNQSSTLDTAWTKPDIFGVVLERGCLDLLMRYNSEREIIPIHVQRAILYHCAWYFRRLINRPERADFLTQEQRDKFLEFLDKIFYYIDEKTILEFELAGMWFMHKVGLLRVFKGSEPNFQIAYVENYDSQKHQIQLRYFTSIVDFECFSINDQEVFPSYIKIVNHDFLGRDFVQEKFIWLSLPDDADEKKLCVRIGTLNARISMGGKHYPAGIKINEILKYFYSKNPFPKHQHQDLWVLIDSSTRADDNAEHLYRYLRTNVPEQPAVFVLRKESADWQRLEDEGFDLIAYGSAEHEFALRSCEKIISSHADAYIVDYFKDGSLSGKQFVFLQHGVIHNDLSEWLNSKKRIDCFVTSAHPEYQSIVAQESRYKFGAKEVVLTGLPRHDSLLKSASDTERIILIMPTWRKSIVGAAISGNVRGRNENFMRTHYAQAWNSIFSSPKIKFLIEDYKYKVIFCPHDNIRPYVNDFDIPSYIEVFHNDAETIQSLFRRASVMITDYSSVAFDFAYLMKPIIYYQFDEEEILKGGHTFHSGYFEYRRDGFGPIVTEEAELFAELKSVIQNNTRPDPIYEKRMRDFFPFRDGKCCERVVAAIRALDEPLAPDHINLDILHDAARTATQAGEQQIAEARWSKYLKAKNFNEISSNISDLYSLTDSKLQAKKLADDILASRKVEYIGGMSNEIIFAQSARESGHIEDALQALQHHENLYGSNDKWHLEMARLANEMGHWEQTYSHYMAAFPTAPQGMAEADVITFAKSHRMMGQGWKAAAVISQLPLTYQSTPAFKREWAQICSELHAWNEAEKTWRSLIGIDPEAHERVSFCLRMNHKFESEQAFLLSIGQSKIASIETNTH